MGKNKVPAYRIIALANLDLGKFMDKEPITLHGGQRVKWDVEETDYHYIAKGSIHIPVEMYFDKPEDPDVDPQVRRVIVSGKRVFDARLDEIEGEDDQEPNNYGIDEEAVRVESFVRYKSNMSDTDKRNHV